MRGGGAATTADDVHAEVIREVDHLCREALGRLVVVHLAFDD